MTKRFTFITIVLVLIFGGTFAWYAVRQHFMRQFFAHFKPPPVVISASKAQAKTWSPTFRSVGSLVAVNGVDVNSEVQGQIVKIFFKSGQMVNTGDPLVQLDDLVDQQVLKDDLAKLELNQIKFQRQLKLYQTRATSKSNLDSAKSNLQQIQAAVAKDKAMIAKKLIKAPFAGKLGIRQINIGEYVQPGQAMVSLQAMNPLFVNFSLPGQDLPKLTVGQGVSIAVQAYPQQFFQGKITAINSKVDVNTRNISVQATIPNPDLKLIPGMFADVNVILPQKQNVITVPQTAISYSLYGDTVYVITEKGKDKKGQPILIATQKYVSVGERKDAEVIITKGVKAGDRVVTSGQLKLHSGSTVKINNSVKLN